MDSELLLTEEKLPDGRVLKRDQQGKVRQASLPPEIASRMGRARGAKAAGARSERVLQLLRDRGINPDDADEGLATLAEIAISGRSGGVAAMRYLDTLSGHYTPDTGGSVAAPRPGEQCPTCHQWNFVGLKFPEGALVRLREILTEAREIAILHPAGKQVSEREITDKTDPEKTMIDTELV